MSNLLSRQAGGQSLQSRDLALMLTVLEAGSIRRAATALHLSPAAVSKALRQVEARLGGPIFLRAASGVEPTVAGSILLEEAHRLIAELGGLEQRFQNAIGSPTGEVRIGSGAYPAPGIGRVVVPEARRRWPGIRIRVELGNPPELLAALRRGDHDFLVCHVEDAPLPPGVIVHRLQRLRATVLVRPGHPLAGRGLVLPHALAGFPFAGSPFYQRVRRWLEEQTGAPPVQGFVGPDFDIAAEVVLGSDMLTIVSQGLAASLGRSHGLVPVPVDWEPFAHDVCCVLPETPLKTAARLVHGLVVEALTLTEEAPSTQG